MVDYTWWGSARVTPWMHYQLSRLDADLRRNFGVGLVANSGIRLPQEQIDIFLQRYVRAGDVRGRKVYDTRWWNGVLWYRISPAGTVAVPGTSNHEVQGSKAAVDIADTGSDAGITSRYSARGQWIRRNAGNYNLIASGDGFGEGWHFDIVNIFNAVPSQPAGGGGSTSKEWDEMASKQEIKDALFEVMGSRPDAVVIHSNYEGRNGIYLAAPGYWHQFTEEQWKQFKDHGMYSAIRELVPVNARDFDVFKEIYTLNQGMVSSITDAQVATITKSVQESLKTLTVDADVDDATVLKIANAAVDRLVARAKD